VPQERSANDCLVAESRSNQRDGGKGSVLGELEDRYVDLREMNVYLKGTAGTNANDHPTIDDLKIQFRGEQIVDAALLGARIDQGLDVRNTCLRRGVLVRIVRWVKSYMLTQIRGPK
jgi:hypothetical protein